MAAGVPVLAKARELLESGRPDEAREVLAAHLREEPGDGQARYLAAVCARFQRDFSAAAALLAEVLEREPENGRALQELAHLARDRGDAAAAIRLYGEALRANPALLASYRQRIALLEAAGRGGEAQATAAALRQAETLPPVLLAVTDLLSQGQVLRAEALCRRFLQQQPHHPEAMRLLAEVAMRLGALEEAHFLLESACELNPGDPRLRIELIRVLGRRQRFTQSLEAASRLLESAPDNLQYQSLRAIELLQLGRYEEAIAGFDAILAALPGDAVTLTSRGHALKTCGRSDDAIASYEAAAQERGHAEAWYALANLKTYRFDDAQLEHMRRLLDEPGHGFMDRIYLSFALAKALEDRGSHEAAFRHLAYGNALKRRQTRYRAARFSEEVDAQVATVTRDLLQELGEGGCPDADPIFIVGMPRAGSTLLEQILAAHSLVDGTRELPNMLTIAQTLRRRRSQAGERPGYPAILRDLDGNARRCLGESYLEESRIHRGDAPFFIDKMPNNFRHIGLIHLILPNARIIDARREPMACCFSNFQQLFAEGQEFSYDLADLGHYYRDYERLMAHWDAVLPGRVYRLQHERLLDDFEGEVQRLLAHLELPFEAGCLRYWESDRAVRTPSSEQVRRPPNRDAVDRWKDYAAWLGPLREALGGEGESAALPGHA